MKVVDTLVIAQDKSIIVLKADKKYYLISVTPTDVKLITEMNEFEEKSEAFANEINSNDNIDFKNILTRILPSKKK